MAFLPSTFSHIETTETFETFETFGNIFKNYVSCGVIPLALSHVRPRVSCGVIPLALSHVRPRVSCGVVPLALSHVNLVSHVVSYHWL